MTSNQRIVVTEENQVGDARRQMTDCCRQLGYDDTLCGEVAIVVSEVARNLVRHGGGGEILWRKLLDVDPPALELVALDQGAGMANVATCLRDGFSTGGTAGNGLGAIQRLSRRFEIHSMPGRGTAVWAQLGSQRSAAVHQKTSGFITGGVSVALAGEDLCGDGWEVQESPDALRVILVDGLGHGPFAEEAARQALAVFRKCADRGVVEILELSHRALMNTRGAAASAVEIRPAERKAISAGVGNVAMRLQSVAGAKSLVSDNGTLGSNIRKVQPFVQPWEPGTVLIMHSDGVGSNWNLNDYPGLARRHPSLIAGVLYRDFRRRRDDATVVVASYQA